MTFLQQFKKKYFIFLNKKLFFDNLLTFIQNKKKDFLKNFNKKLQDLLKTKKIFSKTFIHQNKISTQFVDDVIVSRCFRFVFHE